MANSDYICETQSIAAYIDGDLEPKQLTVFEDHLKECKQCASELQAQRLFMCELESALASPFAPAVPANFAQVVTVNAESDMRGARDAAEQRRALQFCLILGLAAFALLGFAYSKTLLLNAQVAATRGLGALGFLAKTIFDAAAGFVVLTRVVSRALVADSLLAAVAGVLFLVFAVAVLSRLISRYHRTRLVD